MIFKTFENDLDGLINKIGIFNKSFNTIGRDISKGHGILNSLFSGNNVTSKDIQAIIDMNESMKNGTTIAQAWRINMSDCTVAAKQQAKQCLINKGSLLELVDGLKQTTIGAKASQIALKALAIAGNMIAMWAVSAAISATVKGLDNLIHASEKCKERVDDLVSSYKSALSTANSNAEKVEELAGK